MQSSWFEPWTLRKKINNLRLQEYTLSVSQYLSILENNFVSLYLSLSSFNATLIIGLSIIHPYLFIVEREIING